MDSLIETIVEIINKLFTQRRHIRQIFTYALQDAEASRTEKLDPHKFDWDNPHPVLIQELVRDIVDTDRSALTRLLVAIKTYVTVKYKRGLITQDEADSLRTSVNDVMAKISSFSSSGGLSIENEAAGEDAIEGEAAAEIGIEIDDNLIPEPLPIDEFPTPMEDVNDEISDWLKESPEDSFGIDAEIHAIPEPQPLDNFSPPSEITPARGEEIPPSAQPVAASGPDPYQGLDVYDEDLRGGGSTDGDAINDFIGDDEAEEDAPPVPPITRPSRPITPPKPVDIGEEIPDWLRETVDDSLRTESPPQDSAAGDIPDRLKATLDDKSESATGSIVPPPPVPIARPTRPISPPPAPFPTVNRDDESDDEFEGADFQSQGSRGPLANLFGAGNAAPPTAKPVLFSAYFPPKAPVNQRSGLYVYAHTEITKALIETDVAKFVQELGGTVPKPREANQTATLELGTRIKVVPECEELQLEPQSVTKTWRGDWTRFEFEIIPTANLVGQFIFIRVSIRIEEIEIANIKCPIEIIDGVIASDPIDTAPVADTAGRETSLAGFFRKADPALNPLLAAKFKVASSNAYRNIFISYSRRDSQVVRAFKTVQIAMGHEVFLDVDNLRTGENWRAALARAIDRADTFQLFWSQNSAESEYCRYEWDYALAKSAKSNHTDGFIRPVYWRKPMPSPPPELSDLNFKFCEFEKPNVVVAAVRGVMGRAANLFRRLTGRPQVSGSHET